jgi:hypothetical protein
MTYKKDVNRDYRQETEYESQPQQIHNRVLRNKARREAMAKGLVHKHDGMDVDHKTMLAKGGTNAPSNLRVITAARNRGWRDGKV